MDTPPAIAVAPRAPQPTSAAPARRPHRALLFALAGVLLLFAFPLFAWLRFAFGSDLYSYTLLIPCVSLYVVRLLAKNLPTHGAPQRTLATVLLALGLSLAIAGLLAHVDNTSSAPADRLAISTSAFLVTLAGTCAWFLPASALRAVAFPLGFLAFMVPVPTAALHAIETFMQHGSAAVARVLFELAGTPVYYESLTFQIPGIALHVAPECSGIRSTLVLLVVSVVTGFFFLRSPTHRALLAVAIVPLALLRNGFRIAVIGELCVRGGPEMIDSFIHRRGGPIFFALSLIPLFLLLVLLQKRDRRTHPVSRAARTTV